jgi:hypothetical protein
MGKRFHDFLKHPGWLWGKHSQPLNIQRVKGKAIPGQALRVPGVSGLRFQDNRHMKVVRLSALLTGHLYLPGNIPSTHFF